LILFLEVLRPCLKIWESFFIDREISSFIKIWNIKENTFKWNTMVFIILDNIIIGSKIFVIIWSSLPTQRPKWCKSWFSDQIMVGLNNLLSASFSEEVHFHFTTSRNVSQCIVSIFLLSDDWRLNVSVSEENTHPLIFFLSLYKSEWMNTICLFSSSSVIIWSFSTISPHSPCSWYKREFSLSFSKTINSSTRNLKIKLHELISHYEVRSICMNVYKIRLSSTSKFESKWIVKHLEPSSIKWHICRVGHTSY
jgi:hypothetical protein